MPKIIVPGTGYLTPKGVPSGVGLLTDPKKMPGKSWSIPARKACPGAAVNHTLKRDITIDFVKHASVGELLDACNGCYADTTQNNAGHYQRNTVKNAQRARYEWTLESLKTETGRQEWVETMVKGIKAKTRENKEFRWHDAGDVFNPAYGAMIKEVVRQTPEVKHWLPSHSWWIPNILPSLRAIHAEPNATVRPSALKKNQPAPVIAGLGAGTTVITNGTIPAGHHVCPANSRHPKGHPDHGKCLGCRVCWQKDLPNAYPYHG